MVRKWERRHSERHAEVLVRTFRSELLESERFSLVLQLCLIFETCRARSLALPASLSQGRRCGHFDFEHVHDLDRSRFQLVSLYQPRHDRRREPFPTQFKPTDPAPVWVNYFITNLDQSDVSRPITKLYSNTSGKNVFVTGKVKLAGATYLQVSGTVSIDEKNGVPSIHHSVRDGQQPRDSGRPQWVVPRSSCLRPREGHYVEQGLGIKRRPGGLLWMAQFRAVCKPRSHDRLAVWMGAPKDRRLSRSLRGLPCSDHEQW